SGNASDESEGAAGHAGGAANAQDDACTGEAGAGGERELSAYARLRTACGAGVDVNRRGSRTTIGFNIK
ncbi:MAG TPA: hypothetical protein VFQ35_14955, partial [Polyangiaceae bacterium]|nr:hypothetical protein [Polyangiaceae bacterium]